MRALAIANQKGGVGKTTITIGLAAAAAGTGAQVLVLDADPQGHATVALGREALYNSGYPNLASCLLAEAPAVGLAELVDIAAWKPPGAGTVDLVPSSPEMFLAEPRLANLRGREQRLARLLADDELVDRYDLVLIDCPPSLGVLTDNALVAAGEVLIVAGADPASVHGLDLLVDQIRSIRDALGVDVAVAGLAVNRLEATRIGAQTLERFGTLGLPIAGIIPKRTRLQEAWAAGVPVQGLDPAGELVDRFNDLAATLALGRHL